MKLQNSFLPKNTIEELHISHYPSFFFPIENVILMTSRLLFHEVLLEEILHHCAKNTAEEITVYLLCEVRKRYAVG